MASNTNKLILGTSEISNLYLGDSLVDKAYLGSDLLYQRKEHIVLTGYTKSNTGLTGNQIYTGKNKYTTSKPMHLVELQVVWRGTNTANSGSDDVYVNIDGMGWSYLLNIYKSSGSWYMGPKSVSSSGKMPAPSQLSSRWNIYKVNYLNSDNKWNYQFSSLETNNIAPLNDYGIVNGISKTPTVAAETELCFNFQFTIDRSAGNLFVENQCYALLADDEGNTVKFALA